MDPQFGTAAPATANGNQPSPTVASSSTADAHQRPAEVQLEFADQYAELSARLLAGYTSCEFADFQLNFSHADGQQSTFSLHALVVSRAPLLLQMLRGLMLHQPRPATPVLQLSSPDSAVSASALSLLLAALYSPDVLNHVEASNAPSFLATAVYFGLTRFADLAYHFCEESVRRTRTPDEIASWVAYIDRDGVAPQASGAGSESRTSPPLQGLKGGPPPPPASVPSPPAASPRGGNQNNGGLAGPSPASYEGRLLAVLMDRILRLPTETGAFVPPTAATAQAQLVEVLKPLPFEFFKRVIEDPKFEVPSDMDRFNFAKKVVAARKQHHLSTAASSPPGTPRVAGGGPADFEEAVVMQFGSGAGGPGSSAVNVLRKPRKPTLWKASSAV